MNVLTIYAHPNHKSFCHAILEQFTQGLKDAGHSTETVNLYAKWFNPVLKARDYPCWIDENIPLVTLRYMIPGNSGRPIQRYALERWLRNKDSAYLAKMIRKFRPRDVVEQQQKIAQDQGLAITYPVWIVGIPSILKGWIERVFTYGFAYSLKPEGWKDDIQGRIPSFKHDKALLISTTIYDDKPTMTVSGTR